MKKLNYVSFVLSLCSFIGIMFIVFSQGNSEKTGYFLSSELYNHYDYKIELEEELSKSESKTLSTIDSLQQNLKFDFDYLSSIEPTQEQMNLYRQKENYFLQLKYDEELKLTNKKQEYYTLIWDRINTSVKQYGENNNFEYIFGANGDGSIMYANSTKDITEDLVSFINSDYAGE